MIIIPLGLVSKTKSIPFATIFIAVITTVIAIYTFPMSKKAEQHFWHSKNRKKYSIEAKKHVKSRCEYLNESFCTQLAKFPVRFLLLINKSKFTKKLKKVERQEELVAFIKSELSNNSLKLNNPKLITLKNLAEADNTHFLKHNQLLSNKNISWGSSFLTLFYHGGWMHLLGNLLILIFLAFPVEERMGGIFFTLTYFVSGMIGSTLHVLIDPETFYLVGASSSVSGIAGALTLFFWKNQAKVFVSYFFVFSQVVTIPVLIYSPIFLVASDIIGSLNPLTNVAHMAHLGGFVAGFTLAALYNLVLPLPQYYSFMYEFDFYEKAQKGYSQYDRIVVYTKWLYYSPLNLYAFKGLIKQSERSDLNPAVQKELNHFKKNHFNEVYNVNKKNKKFLNLLPIEWLADVPIGDDPTRFKKWISEFEEKREFENAFKAAFLLLNEVGWADEVWSNELLKNFKKSTINKEFLDITHKLQQKHGPFHGLLRRRLPEYVQSA